MDETPRTRRPEVSHLQRILRGEGVGVISWDIATGTCRWDELVEDLLDLDRPDGDVSIEDLLASAAPEARQAVDEALAALRAGQEQVAAVRPHPAEGDGRWLRWRAVGEHTDDGTLAHVLISVSDVTDLRRAEGWAERRRTLDALVRTISTRFIDLPAQQVDDGIVAALADVGSFLEARGGQLFLARREDRLIRTHRYVAPGVAERPVRELDLAALPWFRERLAADEIVVVRRPEDLPAEAAAIRDLLRELQLEAVLVVPLVIRGQLLAAAAYRAPALHDWDDDAGALLRALVEACFLALRRKGSDEQRATATARQAALAELSALALTDVAVPDLARAAAQTITGHLPVPLATITALADGELRTLAGDGWGEDLRDGRLVSHGGDSVIGHVIRHAQPLVVVPDLERSEGFQPSAIAAAHGARSAIAVPIGLPDRPLGCMIAYDTAPRHYRTDEVHLLQSVANLLAGALRGRAAVTELREAHATLAHLVDASPLVMFRGPADAMALDYVSANIERFYGYDAAYVSANWLELVHPDDRDTAIEANELVRLVGEGEYEARFRRGDGSYGNLHVVLRVDREEGDGTGTLIGWAMDITERRASEERIRRGEKLEAVGQLAGGVAHDFNNLLTVMRGYLEVLQQRCEAPELTEVLGAVDRGGRLVEQLLAFSRQLPASPRPTDLNALVRDVLTMLERLLGPHIVVRTGLADDLPPVAIDVGRIEQALVNLLVNARDAMPDGGTVTISTELVDGDPPQGQELTGPHVRLQVADDGVGMSSAVQARIFEPFFTTKGGGGGTGLGLPAAYGAVRSSGGTITVDSAPGAGAVFTLQLPITDEPVVERTAAPVADQGAAIAGTILVVEDQEPIRRLVERVLSRLGYTVRTAAGGDVALEIAAAQDRIDLLLTDVSMPGLSGGELATRLRAERPDLPVLFMSGYRDQDHLEGQRSAFLQKPFGLAELVEAVQRLLPDRGATT
jgi:PAS domain S-box-containing protein